mgnify:CR=1 FL=1
MAGKSYRRIAALAVTEQILKYLSEQRGAVSASEIAQALNIQYGTVMCHLATIEEFGWVRKAGEHWELGLGLSLYWARSKSQLEGQLARINSDLEALDG